MNLLEDLRMARAEMTGDYEFLDFTRCTCGHIYTATHGKSARTPSMVLGDTGERYFAVLHAVLTTYGKRYRVHNPVNEVSSLTASLAEVWGYKRAVLDSDGDIAGYVDTVAEPFQTAAVRMLDETIARIEAEERKAMLDVVAQAEKLTEREPVLA